MSTHALSGIGVTLSVALLYDRGNRPKCILEAKPPDLQGNGSRGKKDMQTKSPRLKLVLSFFSVWAVMLLSAVLLSVFLHELAHGVGARLDRVHVSTGFNKVGNPNRTPDDPDFRTGMAESVLSSMFGPILTWVLAIAFTSLLHLFSRPRRSALVINALAQINCTLRALPVLFFLIPALIGRLHVEDEVSWGIWYVKMLLRPELARMDIHTLAATQSQLLLSYPAVWFPSMASLVISLACLALTYAQSFKLWSGVLSNWRTRSFFFLLPPLVWLLSYPLLDALDRVVRINW